MAESSKNTTATVIPGMRYKDAPEAIKWLCKAFGFKEHLVVPNEDGTIATTFTFNKGSFDGELKQYHPKGFILDDIGNLGVSAAIRLILFNENNAVSFLHRITDRFFIERA